MSALRIELRRGVGPWAFLPLTAFGLVAAQGYLEGGRGIWPVSASAVGLSAQLVGPLLAGAAAYAGGRARRRGTDAMELLSARSASASAAAELGALQVWLLAAFAVIVAAVYVPTALGATWSGPPLTRTAAAWLGLVLIAAAGYTAGRIVGRRFTPLAVAVATYGVVVFGYSSAGYRYGLFSPADLNLYDQFRGPSLAASIGQLAWYSGAAAAVFAAWASVRTRSRAALGAAVAAAVLAAAGAATLAARDGQAYADARTDVWDCTAGPPQICIHPALRRATETLTPQVIAIGRRLEGTPFALSRVEQRPRGVGGAPSAGAVAFALDDLRPASIRGAAQDVAVNSLRLTPDTCYGSDGALKAGAALNQIVTTWLLTGGVDAFTPADAGEDAAKQWFAAQRDERRRAWLAEHGADLPACDLVASDFR